ncbi:WYL domain-containing protein [Paenibacillus sp. FSL E2-0201]|uniref:helix-turn-helix transcriptional regulator n=1 Tax=Paenibacillus sp. FSL E2-0201 TaxID=2954726 RepID=UPI0030DA1CEC
MDKTRKLKRILMLYEMIKNGEKFNKSEMALEFGVHERSIQRDIDDIRSYLYERHTGEELVYSYSVKAYQKTTSSREKLTEVELLAVTKILIESRAFTRSEMQGVIQSIINQAEKHERISIKEAIQNEMHHYKPLNHNKPLLELIWVISNGIRRQTVIQITYERMDGNETQRRVMPLSIVFSEFYFYLVANIENSKYDEPAFFRLDRLKKCDLTDDSFRILQQKRFEAGELRNRIQFMYSGELIRLQFEFWGPSLSAVLDRFPNGSVIKRNEHSWIIEAQVYGTGCIMWLLSQGPNIKVIKPQSLKEIMKEKIQAMAMKYQ